MDLCSLHSWCPEAEGAFCLGVAGLYPFLGAVEKLPCGSRVSGGCATCVSMKAALAVGTSRRSVLKPARAAPEGTWALPKGKCPRAHAAGLSDGLSRLAVSLEEA